MAGSTMSYWMRRMASRRAALRAAAGVGGGLAALSLVGCGGDDDSETKASSGSGSTSAELDPLKGKPGGKLVFQAFADYGGLVLVKSRNAGIHQAGSFTHSGLYQMRNGRPGVDGTDFSSELDLATAFPEQMPDQLTYTVKIREGAKFHNGRAVTSEDVKYSFERYAFAADSAYKADFPWLDKVDAPDPKTVVFKTKARYADTLGSLTDRNEGHILAKEHEEGPDAANKLVGSGAFLFVERQPPVLIRYKRNPEYYVQPLPYFDEVDVLGTSDVAKKVADFSSRQTHVTYWFDQERRDEVKRNRPDAQLFSYQSGAWGVVFRVDQAPFTDRRVRQAMSMAIDRKQINEATQKGENEDDQVFTWVYKSLGFRKPAELPGAKYWKNDVQTARQLFSAAGITQPIEVQSLHWDPTVVGQGLVDLATLIQTQFRSAGLFNSKDVSLTFAQWATSVAIGNFDGYHVGPGGGGNNVQNPGNLMRNTFWSPPEGIKGPSVNNGHINDAKLSELLDKQVGQLVVEERKQTFRAMEELMSEEQYRLALVTQGHNYFADPTLKNIQIPILHVNGSVHYVKNWWFDKGA